MVAASPNSGYTATLCSAQIQPNGWTSYVRKPLGDISESLKDWRKI